MDVVTTAANYLNKALYSAVYDPENQIPAHIKHENIKNAKACLFNFCTVFLTAFVAESILKRKPSELLLALGCLFGRQVIEASFEKNLVTSFLGAFEFFEPLNSNPTPLLSYNGTVILYKMPLPKPILDQFLSAYEQGKAFLSQLIARTHP